MMKTMMLLALACLAATPNADPQKLRRPGYLPSVVRELLDTRMKKHVLNVRRLTEAVVLLRYDDTIQTAQSILDEPGLSRLPQSGAALNRSLPTRFFDLQDQLHVRTQTLIDAAKRKSDTDIAVAFSRVTETCISCHSVYLKGPEDSDVTR